MSRDQINGSSSPSWFCQGRMALFPLSTLEYWRKKYGATFTVPIRSPNGFAIYLTRYVDIQSAFNASDANTIRANSEMSIKIFGDFSIFNSSEINGDHVHQRGLFIRYLVETGPQAQMSLIKSVVDKKIDSLSSSKISLLSFMSDITVEVTSKLLFGEDLGRSEQNIIQYVSQIVDLIRSRNHNLALRSVNLFNAKTNKIWLLISDYRHHVLKEVQHLLATKWRPNSSEDKSSYIYKLVKNIPPNLPSEDLALFLRDEIITLIFAGMDTTAISTSFGLVHLYSSDHLLQRFKQHSTNCEDIQIFQNNFIEAFCLESVRLFPTIVDLPRLVIKEVQLTDCTIYPNDIIFMAPYLTSTSDNQIFSHAAKFDPDRFLEKTNSANQVLGFSYGQRRCPGARLAILQMSYIIAKLSQIDRLEVTPKKSHRFKSGVFMMPSLASTLSLKV